MKLIPIVSIIISICVSQSSFADQNRGEASDQSQSISIRQKNESLSSAQLGDLLSRIQARIHSISQSSTSLFDSARDTKPLQLEQNVILGMLKSRSDEGDREAGFQYANWAAFLCTGFLKQQIRSMSDPACEFASRQLNEVANRGDLRAMEILGRWYESGTHFERSNYAAAEWYAKIMIEATKNGFKSLAMNYLEKVDRLYPKYPDLESHRRRIHALN